VIWARAGRLFQHRPAQTQITPTTTRNGKGFLRVRPRVTNVTIRITKGIRERAGTCGCGHRGTLEVSASEFAERSSFQRDEKVAGSRT